MELKKPVISGLLAITLLVNLLTPAFAYNSQGSNTDLDNLEGIDKAQDNVATDYWKDLTDQDTADTHVYATRSSTFTALVPKTIILSGIDGDAQYVVGVKGDVFTQDTVTIAPESYELTLQKVGDPGSTVSASITQNTTTVTGADIKDNVYSTMEGSIQAEGLKAGSWKSTITFNIQINETNQTYHYHDLAHVDAAEGTDDAPGHGEYWYCEECDKYYSDVNGSAEISQYDTYVDTIPFTVRADNRGKVNYSETEENLVIPAVFKDEDDGNWYKVTAIDEMAFYQVTGLKTVQIPETVTSIGRGAFLLCGNLESVNIPKGVTVLESRAFSMMALTETEINIPDNITTIGDMVFDGNLTAIHSIKIPASVTSISPAAFLNVPGLRSIEVSPDNPNYSSVDGVLYNKDQTVLIRYPQAKTNEPYTVPDTVKEIGTLAFRNCGSVEVRVPDTVTVIGDNAFQSARTTVYYCGSAEGSPWGANSDQIKHSALVHVAASEATEEHPAIKEHWICEHCGKIYADEYCAYKLGKYDIYEGLQLFTVNSTNRAEIKYIDTTTELNIPAIFRGTDGIWYMTYGIGDNAFSDCTNLTKVTIPDSVLSIGGHAFRACSGLTEVEIPDSVNYIGQYAFNSCTSLESINLPNAITTIERGTFGNCTSLQSITIPDSVTSIGDYAFQNTGLTSVVIGNSVNSIGRDAFKNSNLTSVTIPDSLTTISNRAFFGCTDLESISVGSSLNILESIIVSFTGLPKFSSIEISPDNPNYVWVDGVLFNSDKTVLIWCPKDKTGAYTIPSSTSTINNYAFDGCTGLTSVTIGNSVTSIGSSAFSGVPLVIYDGDATGSPWGALRVETSDGTITYPTT